MNATMTDVQAAIDQLGGRDLGAGASAVSIPLYADEASVRSFASDSLHGGAESVGGGDGDDHEQVGWSAKTRRRLAEKAQAENERKLAREAEEAALGWARDESAQKDWQAARSEEPEQPAPEGLEFSDESEDEGEGMAAATPRLNGEGRRGPESLTNPASFETAPSEPVLAPPIALGEPLHREAPAVTAEAPSASAAVLPAASAVGVVAAVVAADAVPVARDVPEPVTISSSQIPESALPTAAERAEQAFHTASTAPSAVSQEPSPFQTILPDQFESPAVADAKADVEAAAPAAVGGSATPKSRPASIVTRQTSTASLAKGGASPALPRSTPLSGSSPATTPHSTKDSLPELPRERVPSVPASASATMSPIERTSVGSAPGGYMSPGNLRRPSSSTGGAGMGTAGVAGEPIEWGVADVVEWAKRRGFDESVWGKFEGESTSVIDKTALRSPVDTLSRCNSQSTR